MIINRAPSGSRFSQPAMISHPCPAHIVHVNPPLAAPERSSGVQSPVSARIALSVGRSSVSLNWLSAPRIRASFPWATCAECRSAGRRVGMTDDEVECIEEGGTEPTIALLRHLAAALDADVRLTSGPDLGSVWFESHAA